LLRTIDRGEAESISLAAKLGASLVILDDRDARSAAENLGLRVTGVLGVLVQAKRAGELRSVRASMDDLRSRAGFFVSAAVYHHVLTLAGET
jgi:predicted nucleic acid-binding protein